MAPFLCYFKLCASFRSHLWIPTGVKLRKSPHWGKICFDLCDLYLWLLTFYMDNTFVNGKNSWTFHYDTMTGTLWKSCDRRTDRKDHSYSCLVPAKKDNTQNYDRHRHLKFVNPCILSCNRLCRHVWNVLGRYLLCMDAWHFINKTFISIYFIKFPDLTLKFHSDLYSYRKNQDCVYGKGSTMVLGKNKIRFEKYTVKGIMWKKTTT